jgi:hypothetical protein
MRIISTLTDEEILQDGLENGIYYTVASMRNLANAAATKERERIKARFEDLSRSDYEFSWEIILGDLV